MNFDKMRVVDCIVPGTPVTEPRCLLAEYALSHPSICGSALILKPAVSFFCPLESVQFRVYEYRDNLETELTTGLRFESSDDTLFVVGVNNGNGTALAAGNPIITATHTDGRTVSGQMTVLPGTNCCDDVRIVTALVVDNSLSMTLNFGGAFATRLAYAKDIAGKYGGVIYQLNNLPKDAVKVWSINEEPTAETGFSEDTTEIVAAIEAIAQAQGKTDLLDVLTTITTDLLAETADRRILVMVGDGEHTINTDRQEILDAATVAKQAGLIIIAIGVRASGDGFDLLERLATGGFFLNANSTNTDAVAAQLNHLKEILCAGKCQDEGDEYVNAPQMDYSSFLNFEIVSGKVNLLGGETGKYLDVDGLFVELVAAPTAAVIRTIDTYPIVSGHVYRVGFKVAGNQREDLSGRGVKVYVREDGANDSDPNIFETTVFPDWDATLQTHNFTFTAIQDLDARLYFSQVRNTAGDVNPIGNLIDDVTFEDTTTLTMLLDEDFDSENITYVAPGCGPSAALAEIDPPAAPTVERILEGTTPLYTAEIYNVGLSYLTLEGETEVSPFTAYTAENQEDVFKIICPLPTDERVIAIRVWRSLGDDPVETDLYLFAENPSNQPNQIDDERRATFEARYEVSVTAPVTNDTAVVEGGLGFGYYGCCGYAAAFETELIPAMTSNTEPIGIASAIDDSAVLNVSQASAFQAFDGDSVTGWQASSVDAGTFGTPLWLQYQFPSPVIVTGYNIYGQCSTDDCIQSRFNPKSWILQGSNNGTDWTTLDTQTGHSTWPGPNPTQKTFEFSNSTAYAYYRLSVSEVVDPTADLVVINILQFFADFGTPCEPCDTGIGVQAADSPALPNIETTDYEPPVTYNSGPIEVCKPCAAGFMNVSQTNLIPAMTSNTAPSGTVIAGGFGGFNTGNAFRTFDRTVSIWDIGAVSVGYIGYVFETANTVERYSIQTYAAGSAPKAFTFEGSNDGVTWTVLDTIASSGGWFAGQIKSYLISSPAAYTHYRLNVTEITGTQSYDSLQMSEIAMFGAAEAAVCATRQAVSYTNITEAIQLATAAATAAATALLNCVPYWDATISADAPCPAGTLGPSAVGSATHRSYISEADALLQATAAAQAIADAARAELGCEGSNNNQQTTLNDAVSGVMVGKATPYPGVLFLSGLSGTITKVTVTLTGFSHTFPDDIDILLVSPDGTAVLLMSDCGGNNAVTNLNLVLDDDAAGSLPDATVLTSGTFKPTNFDSDVFPSPAPAAPYETTLASLVGETKNGAWNLYIVDGQPGGSGTLSGWTLTII